jgi:hypothetical protein
MGGAFGPRLKRLADPCSRSPHLLSRPAVAHQKSRPSDSRQNDCAMCRPCACRPRVSRRSPFHETIGTCQHNARARSASACGAPCLRVSAVKAHFSVSHPARSKLLALCHSPSIALSLRNVGNGLSPRNPSRSNNPIRGNCILFGSDAPYQFRSPDQPG